MNNDDIVTEDELNEIEGKGGEALDPIEQDQVIPGNGYPRTSDQNAKDALAEGIAGNDDNAQDKPLDEENY